MKIFCKFQKDVTRSSNTIIISLKLKPTINCYNCWYKRNCESIVHGHLGCKASSTLNFWEGSF